MVLICGFRADQVNVVLLWSTSVPTHSLIVITLYFKEKKQKD